MNSSYLFDLASDILAGSLDGLAEERTGNPAPGRTNVAWGVPPADECCEDGGQLTVHFGDSSFNGAVTHTVVGRSGCSIVPRASFLITLYRCVSGPDEEGPIPSPEKLTDNAHVLMRDLWSLLSHLYEQISAGTLVDGNSCEEIRIGDALVLNPEGSCAGFVIPLSILCNDSSPD